MGISLQTGFLKSLLLCFVGEEDLHVAQSDTSFIKHCVSDLSSIYRKNEVNKHAERTMIITVIIKPRQLSNRCQNGILEVLLTVLCAYQPVLNSFQKDLTKNRIIVKNFQINRGFLILKVIKK